MKLQDVEKIERNSVPREQYTEREFRQMLFEYGESCDFCGREINAAQSYYTAISASEKGVMCLACKIHMRATA